MKPRSVYPEPALGVDAVAFVWCEESVLEHFICGRRPDGHIKRLKCLLLAGDGVNFYLKITLTRFCFYYESNTFVIANVNLEGQKNITLTLRLSCFQAEKTRNFVSRSLAIGEVLSTADMATAVKVKSFLKSLTPQYPGRNLSRFKEIGIFKCFHYHCSAYIPPPQWREPLGR